MQYLTLKLLWEQRLPEAGIHDSSDAMDGTDGDCRIEDRCGSGTAIDFPL